MVPDEEGAQTQPPGTSRLLRRLDRILEKYDLARSRGSVAAYVEAITAFNMKKTAAEIDVSDTTLYRYKRRFQRMAPEERRYVIEKLAATRRAELDDPRRPNGA